MGSREKDHAAPHQPLLSSLVVRATDSGGGGGAGGSDYEPGEVRRSDRFSDNLAFIVAWCKNFGLEEGLLVEGVQYHLEVVCTSHSLPSCSRGFCVCKSSGICEFGYRIRAGSGSPVRRRNADHRYSPDFDRRVGLPRGRGFGSGRSPGRYRDYSPPYGRGRGRGGRFADRGFDGPGFGPGPFRNDGIPRNNPNVRPREGDWMCPDPACNNLNFARRDHCNNCKRHRFAPPRRGYLGPPPPPRRFPGPPLVNRSPPSRAMNGGFRSPARGWARESPRDFGAAGGPPPHPRYEGRFPDDHMRRDRLDYPPEDHRGERSKFDRPLPPLDLGNRDRGRDHFFDDRKGYERRPLSPPLPLSLRSPPLPPSMPLPPRRWERDARERSRSPIRGGPPPPKDYRRDMYAERGRDEPRGMGRDRMDGVY